MTRLGRNPFDKKAEPQAERARTEEAPSETVDLPHRLNEKKRSSFQDKITHFLHVDLPAEGFLLGLKAALLLRSVWD